MKIIVKNNSFTREYTSGGYENIYIKLLPKIFEYIKHTAFKCINPEEYCNDDGFDIREYVKSGGFIKVGKYYIKDSYYTWFPIIVDSSDNYAIYGEKIKSYTSNRNDLFRLNIDVIRILETIQPSKYNKFDIIEIPDDMDWEVCYYGHMDDEYIKEKSRSFYDDYRLTGELNG